MSSDLLSDEKRSVLRDFLRNETLLGELADVLNMRMADLDSWSWGSGGVPVEQRRKISGTYNIHMREDLLQAIFLQHIGVKWGVFFRGVFEHFRRETWKKIQAEIPRSERNRLGFYLGRASEHPVHSDPPHGAVRT